MIYTICKADKAAYTAFNLKSKDGMNMDLIDTKLNEQKQVFFHVSRICHYVQNNKE